MNTKMTESPYQQLVKENASLQAKIDELMLEYCPEDMTESQLKTWGENQVVGREL